MTPVPNPDQRGTSRWTHWLLRGDGNLGEIEQERDALAERLTRVVDALRDVEHLLAGVDTNGDKPSTQARVKAARVRLRSASAASDEEGAK